MSRMIETFYKDLPKKYVGEVPLDQTSPERVRNGECVSPKYTPESWQDIGKAILKHVPS